MNDTLPKCLTDQADDMAQFSYANRAALDALDRAPCTHHERCEITPCRGEHIAALKAQWLAKTGRL